MTLFSRRLGPQSGVSPLLRWAAGSWTTSARTTDAVVRRLGPLAHAQGIRLDAFRRHVLAFFVTTLTRCRARRVPRNTPGRRRHRAAGPPCLRRAGLLML